MHAKPSAREVVGASGSGLGPGYPERRNEFPCFLQGSCKTRRRVVLDLEIDSDDLEPTLMQFLVGGFQKWDFPKTRGAPRPLEVEQNILAREIGELALSAVEIGKCEVRYRPADDAVDRYVIGR